MRRVRRAPLMLTVLALLSLIAGLGAGAWRTGQIDPLHWLWPALAALAVMTGYLARIGAKPGAALIVGVAALLVAPPLAVSLVAGSAFSVIHGVALVLVVASVGVVALSNSRRRTLFLAGAIILGATVPTLIDRTERPHHLPHPPTAVLSGVPLMGVDVAQAQGRMAPMPDAVVDRAPFWDALGARRPLVPIDALDASALSASRDLLLVQPRLLQPRELVVLDDWLRAGGHALILADPFLLWPDARAPGHARRPPITSLLDPLFTHWGLRLEAASIVAGRSMLERRLLDDGTLLNVAGASTFTVLPGGAADCRLSDRGFIASCRVGRGEATLVADADFIEAGLWTLSPRDPARPADWISGAVSFVDGRLAGPARPASTMSWIINDHRLGAGLLVAVLMLGAIAALMAALKLFSHILPINSSGAAEDDLDHRKNI